MPYAPDARYCSRCGSDLSVPAGRPSRPDVLSSSRSARGFHGIVAPPARTRRLPGRYAPADGAITAAGAGLLPPGALLNGRYRVSHLLGVGSFGRVYLTEDLLSPGAASVAVKELLDTPIQSEEDRAEAMAWFRREASILLSLRHPAIPALHGFWTARPAAGPVYLAMDYIPGKTLDEVPAEAEAQGRGPGCPWRDVVAWGAYRDTTRSLSRIACAGQAR